MTEDERDEILGIIAYAKMHGAKFNISFVPVRDDIPAKLADVDVYIALKFKGEEVWKLPLFDGVARSRDLGDLAKPALDDVMPAAREYYERACNGDEEVYLEGAACLSV
jgi:hypothetical protein